ncbi:hypothetical protein VTL71DRAFT_15139 [Oculimacula yallundae]|uniref:Uncharacterized protein n=1 Tax=Oculimacula yallundae TaxID=86028 RepID=A0ABR4CFP7_9HELO
MAKHNTEAQCPQHPKARQFQPFRSRTPEVRPEQETLFSGDLSEAVRDDAEQIDPESSSNDESGDAQSTARSDQNVDPLTDMNRINACQPQFQEPI